MPIRPHNPAISNFLRPVTNTEVIELINDPTFKPADDKWTLATISDVRSALQKFPFTVPFNYSKPDLQAVCADIDRQCSGNKDMNELLLRPDVLALKAEIRLRIQFRVNFGEYRTANSILRVFSRADDGKILFKNLSLTARRILRAFFKSMVGREQLAHNFINGLFSELAGKEIKLIMPKREESHRPDNRGDEDDAESFSVLEGDTGIAGNLRPEVSPLQRFKIMTFNQLRHYLDNIVFCRVTSGNMALIREKFRTKFQTFKKGDVLDCCAEYDEERRTFAVCLRGKTDCIYISTVRELIDFGLYFENPSDIS